MKMNKQTLKVKNLSRAAKSLKHSAKWRALVNAVIDHYNGIDNAVACGVDFFRDHPDLEDKSIPKTILGIKIPVNAGYYQVVDTVEMFNSIRGVISVSHVYKQWIPVSST